MVRYIQCEDHKAKKKSCLGTLFQGGVLKLPARTCQKKDEVFLRLDDTCDCRLRDFMRAMKTDLREAIKCRKSGCVGVRKFNYIGVHEVRLSDLEEGRLVEKFIVREPLAQEKADTDSGPDMESIDLIAEEMRAVENELVSWNYGVSCCAFDNELVSLNSEMSVLFEGPPLSCL